MVRYQRDILGQRAIDPEDVGMSASRFYVPTLPGMPLGSTLSMYAGEIPSTIDQTTSSAHLFFFLIRNKHISGVPRLLLWFNGGAGCSSFDGALMEVGPLRMVLGGKGELREAEGAWNEYTNILFIDQPAGTGYSYADTNEFVHELPEMAGQVVTFMQNFLKVFPEFKNQDMYIAGESYAGQYIPYIADAFLKAPEIGPTLKGLLIGNGWIDPPTQYAAYHEFAVNAGVIKKGSDVDAKVLALVKQCNEAYAEAGPDKMQVHNGICEGILGEITESTVQTVNGQKICVNNYDVRLTDLHPVCGMNWPPDLTDITPYLQRPDVKAAFHANRKPGGWVECNGQVGSNFWAIKSRPSISLFPQLLQQVPILLFAGDQDLICNHVGIERLIEKLSWNGESGFGDVTAQEWHVAGKRAGTWTSSRNLTYVKVAEASHMVGYDQPLAAHDMLVRFIGVDLLAAAGPAAQVPSRIGNEQEAVLGETHPNGTVVTGSDSILPSPSAAAPSTNSGVDFLSGLISIIMLIFFVALVVGVVLCVRKRMRRSALTSQLGQSRAAGAGFSREEDPDHELEELVVGGEYSETRVGGRYADDPKGQGRVFDIGEDEE